MMKKKKQVITDDFVIINEIAKGVHLWLYKKGDKIDKYQNGIDRVADIIEVIKPCLEEAKKAIEKYKDRLNGNTPVWNATALVDEGFGKQCHIISFEAETKKEALEVASEKFMALFEEKPNAEIIDIKVKKT